MNFEYIDDFRARARVFGGWIVETFLSDGHGNDLSVSSCFVPDPEHLWELEEPSDSETYFEN